MHATLLALVTRQWLPVWSLSPLLTQAAANSFFNVVFSLFSYFSGTVLYPENRALIPLSICPHRAYTLEQKTDNKQIIFISASAFISTWLVTLTQDSKSSAEPWGNVWLFKLRSDQCYTCQEDRRRNFYFSFAARSNKLCFY